MAVEVTITGFGEKFSVMLVCIGAQGSKDIIAHCFPDVFSVMDGS